MACYILHDVLQGTCIFTAAQPSETLPRHVPICGGDGFKVYLIADQNVRCMGLDSAVAVMSPDHFCLYIGEIAGQKQSVYHLTLFGWGLIEMLCCTNTGILCRYIPQM